ncbi:MAG: DUF11 domain-containing protein [Actinobacteria bacterium]|nr:MAG: DUF11 domain-containing protein [Actinomycetota bacterium]
MSRTLLTGAALLVIAFGAAGAARAGDPVADLHLSESASPSNVALDRRVTLTYSVSNGGPNTASDVGLKVPLGEGWRPVSVSPSTGRCNGVRSIFCFLGDLPVFGHATVRVVARPVFKGTLHPRGGLTSPATDPNPDDNFTAAEVTVADPFTGLAPENAAVHVRDGILFLRYACPTSVYLFCRGRVTLIRPAPPAAQPPPAGPPPTVPPVLGESLLSLPSGVDGKLRVRLNSTAISFVNKARTLPVLVITNLRDGVRTKATRYSKVNLIAPPPKKKKKKKHHH